MFCWDLVVDKCLPCHLLMTSSCFTSILGFSDNIATKIICLNSPSNACMRSISVLLRLNIPCLVEFSPPCMLRYVHQRSNKCTHVFNNFKPVFPTSPQCIIIISFFDVGLSQSYSSPLVGAPPRWVGKYSYIFQKLPFIPLRLSMVWFIYFCFCFWLLFCFLANSLFHNFTVMYIRLCFKGLILCPRQNVCIAVMRFLSVFNTTTWGIKGLGLIMSGT